MCSYLSKPYFIDHLIIKSLYLYNSDTGRGNLPWIMGVALLGAMTPPLFHSYMVKSFVIINCYLIIILSLSSTV